jgi:hypothetical protein
MAGTFAKKSMGGNLPPAGTVTFTIANGGPWVFDDTTHATLVPSAADAALLRNHVGIWLKET